MGQRYPPACKIFQPVCRADFNPITAAVPPPDVITG
jgi:hypothetical protein